MSLLWEYEFFKVRNINFIIKKKEKNFTVWNHNKKYMQSFLKSQVGNSSKNL